MDAAVNGVILSLRDVTKRYDGTEVLKELSLDIRRGQITAIVGANGSGKSTLLRILAGLTAITGGTVKRISSAEQPLLIGYAPDRLPRLRFTAREYLAHMAAIAGMDRISSGKAIDSCLERFELNAGKIQMRHFSKGMLQKVNLIQAILRQPDLLLLDEPHGGLDPDMRKRLAEAIRDERRRGAAVVVASHDVDWVRRSADRSMTLASGRIVGDELISRTTLQAREIVCLLHPAFPLESCLRLEGVIGGRREGERCRFKVETSRSDEFLKTLLSEGASVLVSAWLANGFVSLEHESQRFVTAIYTRSVTHYETVKLLMLKMLGVVLALFATVYPIVFGKFDRTPSVAEAAIAWLCHVVIAALGIACALFFSDKRLSRKSLSLLSLLAVLAVSLAGQGLHNRLPDSIDWIVWIVPPAYRIADLLIRYQELPAGTIVGILLYATAYAALLAAAFIRVSRRILF